MGSIRNDANSDKFSLGSLPTELLDGVTQRLRGKAKKEVELVDRRLAAIARRSAWRHRHELKVRWSTAPVFRSFGPNLHLMPDARVSIGERLLDVPYDALFDGVYSMHADVARLPAAARFLTGRARLTRVEFYSESSGVLDDASLRGVGPPPSACLRQQQQCRVVVDALLASPRVALRSLSVRGTAEQLFGGVERLVALIGRHSATLREAALGLSDKQREPRVYAALAGCPDLRKLTAVQSESSLTLQSLSDRPLQRPAHLSLVQMWQWLRRLTRCPGLFAKGVNWSALANVRLLECHFASIGLDARLTHARAEAAEVDKLKWLFVHVLPNLKKLILHPPVCSSNRFWFKVKVLAAAFLHRAGNHSLTIQLPVMNMPFAARLTEWRTTFPNLLVEPFGEADAIGASAASGSGESALPVEFACATAANCDVFVLRRPTESRRLTIAVWDESRV